MSLILLQNIIFAAIAIFIVVVIIHAVSAIITDRKMQYLEISYTSPKIGPELNGYTIAFITDCHHLALGKLRDVARNVKKREVDLLLLGGDFARGTELWRSMKIMGTIGAKDGIYGVDGNHDDWKDLYAAMRKYNMTPLDNCGVHLRGNLYLAGVEDLWKRSPNINKAIEDANPGDFVFLLAHNPYLAMMQDTSRVDIMLAGHTHGGHISFFGKWTPALTNISYIIKHRRKFIYGWVKTPCDTDIFISRGTGSLRFIPRVFAQPQVVFLTLRS